MATRQAVLQTDIPQISKHDGSVNRGFADFSAHRTPSSMSDYSVQALDHYDPVYLNVTRRYNWRTTGLSPLLLQEVHGIREECRGASGVRPWKVTCRHFCAKGAIGEKDTETSNPASAPRGLMDP